VPARGRQRRPVFGARDGLVSVRLIRNQINAACTKTGIPLEPIERAALDLCDELAHDPDIHLDMDLQTGDIQFCNNYVTLHSRTSYIDFPAAERRRRLRGRRGYQEHGVDLRRHVAVGAVHLEFVEVLHRAQPANV
jgi:hypothetical protein